MPSTIIAQENARTDGVTPKSYWDVAHTSQIEGFATDISVDAGGVVDFKINVNGGAGSDYRVEIFRLGYYGGDGARKVAEWVNTDATVQPDAAYDAARALIDAGNWSVTDSWDSPADAVSGVYLARLQRLDDDGDDIAGAVNQIPFILRDDDRPADIVLQTSDTTWHAYNAWFGNNGQVGANLYGDLSGTVDHPDIPGENGGAVQDRAYAVSYNRPFVTRGVDGGTGGYAAGPQDYLFGADYAAIHWLEENGYDVSYVSGLDTDRLGPDYLKKYEAFISVGHDEYWSDYQRANVEAARDAGTNLLFWGGNDVYWKTRWETSIVDGTEIRTLVCYKETLAVTDPNAGPDDYVDLDPTNIWTGTWRDTRFNDNPAAVGGDLPGTLLSGQLDTCHCAELALTGQLFAADGTGEFGGALDVPESYAPLRIWRDTSIAQGGALDIAPGILGYEWNESPEEDLRPDGLIHLSESIVDWSGLLVDQGNSIAPGTGTHQLSLYRAPSGALVFGAGTVFWSWALSDEHDSSPYGANIENSDLQQAMVNLFADMGIQPAVGDAILASQGLVRAAASGDQTAATALLDDLPDTVPALGTVVLTGTATDDDGNPATEDGVVALVEVSFDGGQTWSSAQGTTQWTYDWTPVTQATYDVRVRAIDDSLNLPDSAGLPSEIVEVGQSVVPDTLNLFGPWEEMDGQPFLETTSLQLGMVFTVSGAGEVTELRYWRDAADADDTDLRAGRLWDASGQLIATAEFQSAPGATGWQTAQLASPVSLAAGAQYIVAYETLDNYVATEGYFTAPYSDPYGQLTGSSGVYAVGTGNILPTQTYEFSNYWIDVTFAPEGGGGGGGGTIAFTSAATFDAAENGLAVGTVAATDPQGDPLTYAVAGGADAGLFSIDGQSGALVFQSAQDFEAPGDADGNGVYELVVSASDGTSPAVQQSLTVTLVDVEPEGASTTSTLFAASAQPAYVETGDSSAYELGTIFQPTASGEITSLRYWRGAADAGDTDTRTLNLWSAGGAVLASATVTSTPGQTGWQSVLLGAPVAVAAGQSYTVSYGTNQNYAISENYFTTGQTGPGGALSSPANAGVYSAAGPGAFPTSTWLGSNYWVDVAFSSGTGGPGNGAPAFTFADPSFEVTENATAVAVLSALDPEGDELIFSIAGGADAGDFSINSTTGALSFLTAPDFETPADTGGDNVYELLVAVADAQHAPVTRAITVTVLDDPDEGGGGTIAFTSAATFNAAENGLAVGTVAATDPQGDALTYAIAGGADGGLFSIDSQSGALVFQSAQDFEAPGDADADGVYELVVSATDGNGPAVQQNLTVTLADIEPEGTTTASTLFAASEQPAYVDTGDPTAYELGTIFRPGATGDVIEVRYWRGAADAGDTDTRTLNLWSAGGTVLASATVTSTSGETGWQGVALETPVAVTTGQSYTVSYGTSRNYAISENYFSATHVGPDGVLDAPAGAGVYSDAGPGAFPTSTWLDSNYWVDVVLDTDPDPLLL